MHIYGQEKKKSVERFNCIHTKEYTYGASFLTDTAEGYGNSFYI